MIFPIGVHRRRPGLWLCLIVILALLAVVTGTLPPAALGAHLRAFGVLEIDGRRYEHDVVIEEGRVRKRKKGPSRPYRQGDGHTPLSADEAIPWSAPKLIIGTGASGQLPIMPGVYTEAERRGVELIVEPTALACARLRGLDPASYAAILHVTC